MTATLLPPRTLATLRIMPDRSLQAYVDALVQYPSDHNASALERELAVIAFARTERAILPTEAS